MAEIKATGRAAGLNEWPLTGQEVLALLEAAGTAPESGSPLRNKIGGIEPGSRASVPPPPGQVEAVRRIARPEVVFGVMNSPPDPPETSWFYGLAGEDGLARFEDEATPGGGFGLLWPVRRRAMTAPLFGSLETGGPALPQGMSLALDHGELQTLVAICDIVQEDGLVAFINRSPALKSRFEATDLYQSYYRSMNAPDLRWMAQRMRFMAPVDLLPTLDGLAAGLASLAGRGLLVPAEPGYAPSDKLGLAVSMMNDCRGFGAVSKRVLSYSDAGEPAWRLGHLGLLAGDRALWLFDFEQTESGDIKAVLTDTDIESVEKLVEQRFLVSEAPVVRPRREGPLGVRPAAAGRALKTSPAPMPKPASKEAKKDRCRDCGAALDPGVKFCSMCGAKAGKPECPGCHAPAVPGDKFCGECGQPLG